MPDVRPIPIPLSQRWRRIRYQFLPVLVFGAALSVTIWLWGYQAGLIHASGEAEVARLALTAPVDGMLIPIERPWLAPDRPSDPNAPFAGQWQLFDKVKKNQLLARMDDGPALAELAVVQSEVAALSQQLIATDAQTRQDLNRLKLEQADREYRRLTEARRLAVEIETLRLDILDRTRRILADQAAYKREQALLEVLEQSQATGAATEFEVMDKRLWVATLADQIKGRQGARAKAEEQLKAAEARQQDNNKETRNFPKLELASTVTLLAPIRAAIGVQQSRLAQIKLQIDSLDVRAPFDGMIREIFCWPNQTVRMGEPLMILVAETSHVITYVREHHLVAPKKGMPVTLRVRTLPLRTVKGEVDQIGPQVVSVPLQLLRDPQIPEWGLPVRITVPPKSGISPGELVDITFHIRDRR
ncbi:MAG: HlyD family efflux transporter periplasmic adaptor subunit [Phycisphaerae bacterium]